MAEELKARGNTLFKAGKCLKAAKCYSDAEKLDPNDWVYPSNLSAALYELGDLPGTIDAIKRTWVLVQKPKTESTLALRLRLSSRLVKTLCHGLRNGSVSLELVAKEAQLIEELENAALAEKPASSPSVQECSTLWKQWRSMEIEVSQHAEIANEARHRLSLLPVFKRASKPALEFYTLGHDDPMSLLDDWGYEKDAPVPIDKFTNDELSKIAFLLGGVGDARHAYATLIGAHRAQKKLPAAKRGHMSVHITMLDIHPGALARDLCVAMLLHQLMEVGESNAVLYAEIMATIMYIFLGVVLPPYSFDRLVAVMKDIQVRLSETPPRFPNWINVNSGAISGMQDILQYWLSIPKKHDTEGMLRAHIIANTGFAATLETLSLPNLSREYREMILANIAQRRREGAEMLDNLGPPTLKAMGLAPLSASATPAERAAYKKRREEEIDDLCELMERARGNARFERDWYDGTKVFVPPAVLWDRHPNFEVFRQISQGARETVENKAALKKIKKDIPATWKPNITLFDPARNGYPNIDFSVFEVPNHIADFTSRFDIGTTDPNDFPDSPTYNHAADFFGATAKALKALDGHVKLEFLLGELTQELSQMSLNSDHTRPKEFPRSFTRSYLSNVPDYTHGTLNSIVYALPAVQNTPYAAVAASCMVNPGAWKDNEEYMHTYTLLRKADIPRYLGCTVLDDDAISGLITLKNEELPRPLSVLASRNELTTWLTRVFLCTIVPGSGGTKSFRVRLPNNVVAFFGLLVHLVRIGFPPHWIGEFVQILLSGKMVTDIAPFQGEWPIPVSEIQRRVTKRTIRLDPWFVELETILALSMQGLPFAVVSSPEYNIQLKHDDIGMYEAPIVPCDLLMGTMANPIPVGDAGVGLLFFKKHLIQRVVKDDEELVQMIPKILNGATSVKVGDIWVFTATELVEHSKIRWRMSKERVAGMRKEQWAVVGYRTDAKVPFTFPVPTEKWIEA